MHKSAIDRCAFASAMAFLFYMGMRGLFVDRPSRDRGSGARLFSVYQCRGRGGAWEFRRPGR